MATNVKLADEVMDIARRITRDATDSLQSAGLETSEDWADAFHAVGQLFSYVSAKMLHDVYKDDNDQSVKEHMDMVLRQATQDADEALGTLVAFGTYTTKIELLGS